MGPQRFRHDFVTQQQQMTSVRMAGVGVYVLRESEMGVRPGFYKEVQPDLKDEAALTR